VWCGVVCLLKVFDFSHDGVFSFDVWFGSGQKKERTVPSSPLNTSLSLSLCTATLASMHAGENHGMCKGDSKCAACIRQGGDPLCWQLLIGASKKEL
jgi:hypothetical protein